MRSVLTVIFLLLLVMYMFAIAFTQLAKGTNLGQLHFSDVGESMYTLLIYGVFLDSLQNMSVDMEQDIFCLMLFFFFVVISALTLMNMLIGVLCEVVSAVSRGEKDSLHVNTVKEKLQQVLHNIGSNSDESISKFEFLTILGKTEVAEALRDVGVDPVGIVDFADYIFDEEAEDDALSFQDFMNI